MATVQSATNASVVTRNREILALNNSRVYYLPTRVRDQAAFDLSNLLTFPAYLLLALLTSIYAFSQDRFEVVVAFFAFPQGLIAAVVSTLTKRPMVLCTDGSDVDVFMRNGLLRAICRSFIKRVRTVTVMNEEKEKKVIESMGIKPVIFNVSGVDTEKFTFVPFAEKKQWKAVAVSRYSEEKGLLLLLESVRSLAVSLREVNFHLFLLGYGPQEKELRNYVEQNSLKDIVSVMGRVRYSSIQDWYRDAAIFILPSYREGLSQALLEAMASGCICLVSDITGNKHVISSDRLGYTFRCGDFADLGDKLQQIISRGESLAPLSMAARERVENQFSVAANAQEFRNFLEGRGFPED
jgi:glycosyltransferase involved in cell wall biosynthesis